MRIIIIEDETAATANLRSMIMEQVPHAEIIAVLESVAESVNWFSTQPAPDVVFMDIHLADGDAFRIFDHLNIACPIIFTTAYDRYAIDAFRVYSIDYLLKPIKPGDLKRALDKLEFLSGIQDQNDTIRQIGNTAEMHRKRSLLIYTGDKILPLSINEIAMFYTYRESVTVYTLDGKQLPYSKTLDQIIRELPPADFFRANRQFIVARAAISSITIWFGSRLLINTTVHSPEQIVISKMRSPEFKKWIGGES